MNEESADYELPVNQRIVGEVVYDHETDETAIQTEDGLITFQSLVKGLACLEGYKVAIEITDPS